MCLLYILLLQIFCSSQLPNIVKTGWQLTKVDKVSKFLIIVHQICLELILANCFNCSYINVLNCKWFVAVNKVFFLFSFLLFRWRRWSRPDCRRKLWHSCGSIYRQLASSCYRQLCEEPVKTVCYSDLFWRVCVRDLFVVCAAMYFVFSSLMKLIHFIWRAVYVLIPHNGCNSLLKWQMFN